MRLLINAGIIQFFRTTQNPDIPQNSLRLLDASEAAAEKIIAAHVAGISLANVANPFPLSTVIRSDFNYQPVGNEAP